MLTYKGYIAAVDYDDSVDELHAYVVNSGPYSIANCFAKDVEGLKRELALSIDDYLASCNESGIEPQKPFSGKVDIQLGPELLQKVTIASTKAGLSLNAWITQSIETALRNNE